MKTIIISMMLLIGLRASAQEGLFALPPMKDFQYKDQLGATGIAVDDTGRVWVSHAGYWTNKFYPSTLGLITIGSDSTWKQLSLANLGGPSTVYLTSIAFYDHALWIGSDKGLIRKKGNAFKVYTNPHPHLAGDTVNQFTIKGPVIYMAMQNGVHVYFDNMFARYWQHYDTTNSSLPTNHIYSVDRQDDGILWLATDKGVVRFDPAKNESKIYSKGNSEFATDTVLSIKVLPNGDVWAGTLTSGYVGPGGSNMSDFDQVPGLYKLSGSTFRNIITLLGLCDMKLLPKNNFFELRFRLSIYH